MNYARLNELIKQKGIKKAHICRELGRSVYYLRDAERNNIAIVGEPLEIIARVVGTTPEYLTDKSDEPKPKRTIEIPHEKMREVFAEGGVHVLLDTDNKMPANHLLDIIDYIKSKQQENDRR